MNATQARRKRAELEATVERAGQTYAAEAAARGEAEKERGQAVRALAALKVARASGGATDKAVDAAHRRVAAADRDLAERQDRENSALDSWHATERELDELFAAHLGAFVEDAQAATEQATATLLALQAPWADAKGVWEAAARQWAPLARACRVDGVGAFPVADLFEAVRSGAVVARPPNVAITTGADLEGAQA